MTILQSELPFSSSDYVLALVCILFGVILITYQLISWLNWDLIVRMTIWWNKHVFRRHKEPYQGPSNTIKRLSHIYGIFIFIFGLGLIGFGVMIFVVSIMGNN